jgi:hypothetical protein
LDPEVVGPYIASHVAAVTFFLTAWRWPRVACWIVGAGFILAGMFNIWTVSTTPEAYVQGFGPHAFPPYRGFIYGAFARRTAAFVLPIAVGQIAAGALAFAPLPWRRFGYGAAIVFLLAITPLGIGSAAPSTLIFAAGLILLYRNTTLPLAQR